VKTIILALDRTAISAAETEKLQIYLRGKGFDVIAARMGYYPKIFEVFDLSNLPTAEVEEIRKLVQDQIPIWGGATT